VNAPVIFKYKNRLAKAVVRYGGMSASEAVSAAEARVELSREPALAEIDARLKEIRRLSEKLKANPDADVLPDLYVIANGLIGTAGLFGLEDMGEAAYSLCETATRLRVAGRADWTLIDIHVRALEFLRQPECCDAAHRQTVLDGLLRVASKAAG
jgi:hypothetical protein